MKDYPEPVETNSTKFTFRDNLKGPADVVTCANGKKNEYSFN